MSWMDGTILEKLKVVFEAQYAGYKRDMEQVKNATKQVEKAVEAETSKINQQMNKVSTEHARKEIGKLQDQLAKQQEAVSAQEAVLRNFKNKYQDLMSGVTKDSGISSLEKQLEAAQKELAKLDAQMQPLLDKLTQAEDFEALGLQMPGLDEVRAQIDAILPRYEELDDRTDRLKRQLEELKMNPESTTSAEQLRQQIALAEEKLDRLRSTAGETKQQIDRMMQAGSKGRLKEKVNGIISKMRQLGSSSRSSSREMHSGLNKVSTGMERLKKRLTGLAGSVLIFGMLSKGLNSGKEALGQLLKKDEQFNSSLTATQTNLKAAFMPIYETALPGINALMERLEALSQYLAVFMSTIFSTSRKAAKGIDTVTDAVKDYGSASDGLGLASFDHINNLTTSSSGGAGGMPGDMINEDAVSSAGKFKDFLKELADGTAAFRRALKRLWDDGLSKLGKFSWQGLKDFRNDFLKPLGKWGFGTEGKGLTRLVDIFNEDLNRVPWDEINENLSDFWQAIEPYAENFGEGLIDFLEDCGDIGTDVLSWLFGDGGPLTGLTKWLNDNDPENARKWGYGLGVLAGSIAAFTTASKIIDAITKANEFLSVIGGLKGLGKIAIVVTVAYEGFEIGKEIGKLINPEDVDIYENFKWTGDGGFFDEISRDWASSFDGLCAMAADFENNPVIALLTSAVAGPVPAIVSNFQDAKSQLSELQEHFTEAGAFIDDKWDSLWNGAGTKFQEWKEDNANKLREKKEEFDTWVSGLKESVEGFGKKVKDSIPTAFKTAFKNAANGAAAAINKLIDFLNDKLHLQWDAVSFAGKEIIPAIDIQLFSLPKIPALAKGGIVSQSTIAQIGEAGREAVLPLEHNTGWMSELATVIIRAFQEAVAASGDGGTTAVNVYLQGSAAKFFTAMAEEDRKYYRRTGHSRFAY